MNIGMVIRNMRKVRFPELNQSEFAGLVGITQTYLSQIETSMKIPSINVLRSISKEIRVPLPMMFWLSISENDIPEEKKESFGLIKPSVDAFIREFIN